MKVIIGCEESGVGRRIFQEYGHLETVSCDLKAARDNGASHHQGDIVAFLESFSDLHFDLGLFHPECTEMCVAGNRTYAGSQARQTAVDWTCALWSLAKRKCRRVMFENPASVIFPFLRKMGADVQYVQPWQHGHPEQKKTGLALHALPRLVETKNVYVEMMALPRNQRERILFMSPGENRSRDRSESYRGILEAMAGQWGVL